MPNSSQCFSISTVLFSQQPIIDVGYILLSHFINEKLDTELISNMSKITLLTYDQIRVRNVILLTLNPVLFSLY